MGTVWRAVQCSQVETFHPDTFHRRPKRPVSWQYVDRLDGVNSFRQAHPWHNHKFCPLGHGTAPKCQVHECTYCYVKGFCAPLTIPIPVDPLRLPLIPHYSRLTNGLSGMGILVGGGGLSGVVTFVFTRHPMSTLSNAQKKKCRFTGGNMAVLERRRERGWYLNDNTSATPPIEAAPLVETTKVQNIYLLVRGDGQNPGPPVEA